MRNIWCLSKLDEITNNCGLADRTCRELRQAVNFKASHDSLTPLANAACLPIIRIKDPAIQAKAIALVEQGMGIHGNRRISAAQVRDIIGQLVPPKPKAKPTTEQLHKVLQAAIRKLFVAGLEPDEIEDMCVDDVEVVGDQMAKEMVQAVLDRKVVPPATTIKTVTPEVMMANHTEGKATKGKAHKWPSKQKLAKIAAAKAAAKAPASLASIAA